MYKYMALLMGLIIVVGCTTPHSLRQDLTPTQYTSNKGAKELAICIMDKWDGFLTGSKYMRETSKGYMIYMRVDYIPRTYVTVDIVNTDTGSKTSYYQVFTIGIGGFHEAVKVCQ